MSDTPVSLPRLAGRVKWFNNKSGFGFITVCEGDQKDKDIFVHYSSIRAESSQYKYLVQGEYVEFDLVKSDNENHEYHASDISGIKNGILMCETHRQNNTVPMRSSFGYGTRVPAREQSSSSPASSEPPLDASNSGYQQVRRRTRRPAAKA
jgi:CspA family cold shock protein